MATAKNGHSPLNSLGHAAGGILSLPVRCAGLVGAILFTTLLTACGGGGGGAPAPAPAPAAPPVVQSVQPSAGDPGNQVTVTGSGLSRVTSVNVAGTAATMTPVSDSQLTFVVPAASARSGPITLAGTGFSVQALASFRVYGVPIVTNVSASNAPLSGNLVLTGQDLDRANAFMVGSASLATLSANETNATVRAPATPATGMVRLQDRSGTVRDTVYSLIIWRPISITAFSPTSVLPGDTVTVTGAGLENVDVFAFTSGSSLAVTSPISKTPTSLTVTVPSTASTGQIALGSPFQSDGVFSATSLTVAPKVLVNRMNVSVTPPSPPTTGNGATLYQTSVVNSAGTPLSCENCHGPATVFQTREGTDANAILSRISAAIASPGDSKGMAQYAVWTQTMRGDVAAYIATANGAPNQATIASISLQGAHFSLVSGARISTPGGWLSASVSNLTDTSLTLTPTASTPVGVAMPVELIVTGQPNVQAGSVTVQQNGAVYLFGVQAAQVHSRDITSPSLRLTSGRPFLLRTSVLSTSSMPAPTVTATIAKNGVPLGVFNLAGPPSLSTSSDSYDNSTMFSGVVPGSWVSSGMQVTVEVATSPPMQFTFTPAVASPTKFTVVAVPIQVGVTTGLVPPAGALKDALARIYPVANQDIVIEIGSPLSVNVPTPVTGTELGTINLALMQRQANEPSKVFYGFVPYSVMPQAGTLTTGRAHSIPDLINKSTWLMAASGWDVAQSYLSFDLFSLPWSETVQTMLHELGHLHSRRHAPCGNGVTPSGTDPNYPFSNGKHGTEALYSSAYSDNANGVIAAPYLPANPPHGLLPNDRLGDVMGYCNSSWFSTYNYDYVQKFLEARTAAATPGSGAASAQVTAVSVADGKAKGFLVISGLITDSGVTLAPAQVLPHAPVPPHSGGPYTMTLRTQAGETLRVDFTAPETSEGNARSFLIVLPDPGMVASVEVSKALRAVPFANAATRARAQAAAATTKTVPRSSVTWLLESEYVTVDWNAAAEPFLGVTLVHSDGRRQLIASELIGGHARVSTGTRAPGTRVELTVGTEFSARAVLAD